ncbi:MAG: type II toxin-antitoxin system HigB family toxin [Bacteroidales bacterium]
MRIIAHRTIVLFYNKYSDAQSALEEWYKKTGAADWNTFADIKKTFNSVDAVGNQHYVFNIKGNDYRLVAIVKFKMVYIRYIGTHSDYDNINDCSKL